MKLRPVVKTPGGKRYLADWIIHHLPDGCENMTFAEPFCGAGNVTMNKPQSKRELLNDLDPGIINILRVLRDTPYEFTNRLKNIPYKEDVFLEAQQKTTFKRDIDYAINEFVKRRMSRGGLKNAFAWSERQRGGRPGDENAWNTIIEMLPRIASRLEDVELCNENAIKFLDRIDNDNSVVYCDPPYVASTRRSHNIYDFEMTNDDHRTLAERLNSFKGKVVISGYPSPLYDKLYDGWNCAQRQIANHSSQLRVKQYKTEYLWFNYQN